MRRLIYSVLAIAAVAGLALGYGLYSMFLADCPRSSQPDSIAATSSFSFDPGDIATKSKIIVFVPGALNSIDIFSATKPLGEQGFALVYYRFPGMDGRPLDSIVSISGIADEVIAFRNRYPDKEFHVVGFSIGGQVALEAASRPDSRIGKVAVLGGTVGFPDTFGVGIRALRWVLASAWTRSTTDLAAVWRDFYKVLLFGEPGVSDPVLAKRADEIVAARRNRIVTPTRALVCSHMRDITFRTAVSPDRVATTPVLFLHGRLDVVSPSGRVAHYASGFKRARFEALEHQGHQIFLTEPALFTKVGQFLAP